jgi:hypothetical protein
MLVLLRSRDPAAYQLTLEWLEQRGSRLPADPLAAGGVDHPDARVREAVALALSATHDGGASGVDQFDRNILVRPRERRRTRELVKRRLRAQANHLEDSDLIALAHRGARQDADWAIEELGRRAATGAPVVGLTILAPIEDS